MTTNDINFWEIKLNKEDENSNNNFSNNESLISQANKWNEDENSNNIVHLENIKIQESNNSQNAKLNFENVSIDKQEKKHYHINYRKTFILSFLVIVFTSMVSLWLYFYNNYISNYSVQTDTQENKTTKSIEKIKDFLWKYIDLWHWSATETNIYGENWKSNLDNIIKSNTNYIQKKEQISQWFIHLSNLILSKKI